MLHFLLQEERKGRTSKNCDLPFKKVISENLSAVFEQNINANKVSVKQFLDFVMVWFWTNKFLVRLDEPLVLFGEWLELDYFMVAKAALEIQDYMIGLYFIEYHHNLGDDTRADSWQCLLDCYNGLNDEDGFQGAIVSLDTSNVDLLNLVQQKNEHEQNWIGLWSMQDSILQSKLPSKASFSSLFQSLARTENYHTLSKMMHSDDWPLGETKVQEEHYRSLWRLGQWDLQSFEDDFEIEDPLSPPPIKLTQDDMQIDRKVF